MAPQHENGIIDQLDIAQKNYGNRKLELTTNNYENALWDYEFLVKRMLKLWVPNYSNA